MTIESIAKVQTITTPNGDKMAVVPLQHYCELVEMAEEMMDTIAYDRAKERLARGEDELVPAIVVNRLLGGDNPLRVWREHRGLKAKDVAEKAGIKPAYLSELEKGKKEPSLAVARALARALSVDLDDIAG